MPGRNASPVARRALGGSAQTHAASGRPSTNSGAAAAMISVCCTM